MASAAADSDGLPVIPEAVNSRKLAKTSSRAGLTKDIDLYMVNEKFILTDVPGYDFGGNPGRLHET